MIYVTDTMIGFLFVLTNIPHYKKKKERAPISLVLLGKCLRCTGLLANSCQRRRDSKRRPPSLFAASPTFQLVTVYVGVCFQGKPRGSPPFLGGGSGLHTSVASPQKRITHTHTHKRGGGGKKKKNKNDHSPSPPPRPSPKTEHPPHAPPRPQVEQPQRFRRAASAPDGAFAWEARRKVARVGRESVRS